MRKSVTTVPTRLMIDSEKVRRLRYELIDNHIIIDGFECGKLAISMKNVQEVVGELMDIMGVWKEVRT